MFINSCSWLEFVSSKSRKAANYMNKPQGIEQYETFRHFYTEIVCIKILFTHVILLNINFCHYFQVYYRNSRRNFVDNIMQPPRILILEILLQLSVGGSLIHACDLNNCPCTQNYIPFCGSDGSTYVNHCQLICAQRHCDSGNGILIEFVT